MVFSLQLVEVAAAHVVVVEHELGVVLEQPGVGVVVDTVVVVAQVVHSVVVGGYQQEVVDYLFDCLKVEVLQCLDRMRILPNLVWLHNLVQTFLILHQYKFLAGQYLSILLHLV